MRASVTTAAQWAGLGQNDETPEPPAAEPPTSGTDPITAP